MTLEFESCVFVVIVLGKAFYFFSPLPLSKSRLAVKPKADGAPIPNAGGASADADVRGIVSTWRRCSASRAVAESSLAVANYLLGQYDNFMQFAGQKLGRLDAPKSCNYYWQIMSIMMCLIPLWLYSLMLSTLFALCPGNLNLMFWPVRHPVPTTMVGYRLATNSLDRAP